MEIKRHMREEKHNTDGAAQYGRGRLVVVARAKKAADSGRLAPWCGGEVLYRVGWELGFLG